MKGSLTKVRLKKLIKVELKRIYIAKIIGIGSKTNKYNQSYTKK